MRAAPLMFKSKEAAQVVIFYSAAGPQQYGFLLICLLQDKMTVFNYYVWNWGQYTGTQKWVIF